MGFVSSVFFPLRYSTDYLTIVPLLYTDTEIVSRANDTKIVSMATKSQHNQIYKALPAFLRQMREQAGLSQRLIGQRLKKPQSYVYNCETANRRVDITEFTQWCKACEIDPKNAYSQLLKELD